MSSDNKQSDVSFEVRQKLCKNFQDNRHYLSVYVVIIHPHIFSGETMAVDTKPSAKCISRVNTGGGRLSGPGFVYFSQKDISFFNEPRSDHSLRMSLIDELTNLLKI